MRTTWLAPSLLLSLVAGCGIYASATDTPLSAGTPHARIIDTKFPQHSVVIAIEDVVADFGADNTGQRDATAAFQTAIDAVANLGGGTLWVPAGTYRFDGTLRLHDGVLLHGDWKKPTKQDYSVVGSTILAVHDTAAPFLTMGSNCGVDGLVFWYPEQTLPTAAAAGTAIAFEHSDKGSSSSVTIMNVTFLNPAIGIDTGDLTTTIQNVLLSGIYGSALDTALELGVTTGGGTQIETHLGAKYWSESGLPSPAYTDIAAYMQAHATGILYNDNWRNYNVTIDDFGTGVRFVGRPIEDTVTGPRMVGLEVRNARRAIDIEAGNNFYISNASLDASEADVYVASGLGRSSLLLDEVSLKSGGLAIDDESPSYTVNVMTSTFTAWKGYAIRATGGDAIIAGSTFGPPQAGDKDLYLGPGLSHVIVMSNTFADGLTYDAPPTPSRLLWIDNRPLQLAGGISGFATSGLSTQLVIPDQPQPSRTGSHSLYDVTTFGAVPDCTSDDFAVDSGVMTGDCTDNSAAFQAALDLAGSQGGGTVYVPPTPAVGSGATRGTYYLGEPLKVPAGVELVGSDGDRLVAQSDTRTMLVVEGVEGDPTPFIQLADHAGVRGLTIWYANQNGYQPGEFGYAVQAAGTGDWVISVSLPNASYGVDFATHGSDNHYISKLRGEPYKNELTISKSTDGVVLDYGERGGGGDDQGVLDFPMREANVRGHMVVANPPDDSFHEDGSFGGDHYVDTCVGQIADVYASGHGLVVGAAKNELIVDAYIHSPHVGLQTVADGALGGPTFTLVAFGSETFTGLEVDALGQPAQTDVPAARIVSSEWHTIATDGYPKSGHDIAGSPYLVVGPDVPPSAKLEFFALANHSYTPIGFDLKGGDTIVQQLFSDLVGNMAGPVEAAVRVANPYTGFAAIGGKLINPLDDQSWVIYNGVGDDYIPSPNVALAGVSLASALRTHGPVDLSFQPTW